MIITYFRSSSYNTWSMCPQQYFIEYVLGRKGKANKAADKGTIVHKALEILGRCKLAKQHHQQTFWDSSFNIKIHVDFANDPDDVLNKCYQHYIKLMNHDWTSYDFQDCLKWTQMALQWKDGAFDPRNCNIVDCEKRFDFEIDKSWANFDFQYKGQKLAGKLAIKGTIDLVTSPQNNMLETIDWKTGRRLDWATGKEKTLDSLYDDPQLRIYHYAMAHIYPEYDHFLMTVYFIRDGGPFSITLHPENLLETEAMLQKRFNIIRNTRRPKLRKSWRCTKFCHFGKNNWPDTNKTVCEFVKNKLIQIGPSATLTNYSNPDFQINAYGEAAGKRKNVN